MMGISSIGTPGDDFLPIGGTVSSLAMFSPVAELPLTVGNIEPNGDLCVLAPTTDGLTIAYRKTLVKSWTSSRLSSKVQSTDIEFRPAFLALNEYIRNIYTLSENAGICEVYAITTPGGITTHIFDRHVMILFPNGSISQASSIGSINLGTNLVTYAQSAFRNYFTTTSTATLLSSAVALQMLRVCIPTAIVQPNGTNVIIVPIPVTLGKTAAYGGETPAMDVMMVSNSGTLTPGGQQAAGTGQYSAPTLPLVRSNSIGGPWNPSDSNSSAQGRYQLKTLGLGGAGASISRNGSGIDTTNSTYFSLNDTSLSLDSSMYGPSGTNATAPHLYRVRAFNDISTPNIIDVIYTMPMSVVSSTPNTPGAQAMCARYMKISPNVSFFLGGLYYGQEYAPNFTTTPGTVNVANGTLTPYNNGSGGYQFTVSSGVVKMTTVSGYTN